MAIANDRRRDDLKYLFAVMRNPRYWRDRDPELLRLVELGFRHIYRRRADRSELQTVAEARKVA